MGAEGGAECSKPDRLYHKRRFGRGDVECCGVVAGVLLQHVNRSWDCSQVENELEERDVMDWFMGDEAMGRGSQREREHHGEEK